MMRAIKMCGAIALGAVLAFGAHPAFAQSSKTASTEKAPASPVDINTATQAELEELPGVGKATAKKIIAGRPYSSLSDLSKAGISASTVKKITPMVTVSAAGAAPAPSTPPASAQSSKSDKTAKTEKAPANPVDINTASQTELEGLPGVGKATAKKIIAGRPYSSVNDLSKAGVSASTVKKITPMVTVSAAGAAPAPSTPAAAPAAPAPPASQPSTTSKSASKSSGTSTAQTEARVPPAKGMVWVNTKSGVYHTEGDQWYGKTKEGKFMTEADAMAAGYHASKEGATKKQ
jgi:competence protein ComEA